MMGAPATRPATRRIQALSPSERARIRFAMDDVGAGAMRPLRLPKHAGHARAMQIELAALAAARGLSCVRLDRTGGRRASNLARAVLTLLVEHGPDAGSVVEDHGLHRSFPLALMDGVPVWDGTRHDEDHVRRPSVVASIGRSVARFVWHVAARRPLVLVVDPSALGDPLASAVVETLRSDLSRRRPARSDTGGLLLALPG